MPTKIEVYKKMLLDLASLSKCTDKQNAAIIFDKSLTQILSTGINGGPIGGEQCLCQNESKYGCIHAEANALIKLTTLAENKVMLCTTEPCQQCAAMILNELGGFHSVLWIKSWKEHAGSDMLKASGVQVGEF